MDIAKDKEFKSLKANCIILNIILMIECYDTKKPFSYRELIKLLRELDAFLEEDLVDLKTLSDYESFINSCSDQMSSLKQRFPLENDKIDGITEYLFVLPTCFLPTLSFPVPLLEFVQEHVEDLEETTKFNLVIAVRNILRHIPYDRYSKERIYLSQKYPNHLWYDAYFFENESVPCKEHTFLLEELLKTVLLTSIEDENFEKSIGYHLKQKSCQISRNAFLSILRCHSPYQKQCQSALFAIQNAKVDLPISPISEIDTVFSSLNKEHSNYLSTLISLFDTLFIAFPSSSWISYFVTRLYSLDGPPNIEEHMLEYVKMNYPKTIASYYEDECIIIEQERIDAQNELILTLKELAKKENDH